MIGYQLSINAARFPDKVAMVCGVQRRTYAMLNARACRVANALTGLGIGRGDRVATMLHNCMAFIEIYFAAAKIGAIFVPINFRLAPREVGQVLDSARPSVLFGGEGFRHVLTRLESQESYPRRLFWVDDRIPDAADSGGASEYETWLAAYGEREPELTVASDEVQLLVYTSGTTGRPKGAVWTHATTFASSSAKIIDFGITPEEITAAFGPLFHVGPLMDWAMPVLLRGGRLVIGSSRQFDPDLLVKTILREQVTVVAVYPTMWRRVIAQADLSGRDLTSLRLLSTGGEPMPVALLEAVYARFPQAGFVNTYGSTEGGPITTFLAPADSVRKIGSVGRPAFGVEVRIADDSGRPLGHGQVGELLVRSAFVCRGYWNRPEETAASVREGWWHTGDLALRDEEGFIWISGRKKDMIISGNEIIFPIEVEQVIATMEGVLENAVIGVPDEEWGETVAAYVVTAPDAKFDASRVIEHCRAHLASYKKPRYVEFVESLPRNTTNKVSKVALREQFGASPRTPCW